MSAAFSFPVISKNKKPAELFASAGLELVLPANFASHTRRRAMRVMVVVMMAVRHKALTYASFKSASIRKIEWLKSVSPIPLSIERSSSDARIKPHTKNWENRWQKLPRQLIARR
jgi:hypothetical protein